MGAPAIVKRAGAADADWGCQIATPDSTIAHSMIHHIVLYKLRDGTTEETIEDMMMQTRISLLKIPVVLNVKCGKRISADCQWHFFMCCDFESSEKIDIYRESPIHMKFIEDVIKPHTTERLAMDFEMEPGKDVKYS